MKDNRIYQNHMEENHMEDKFRKTAGRRILKSEVSLKRSRLINE